MSKALHQNSAPHDCPNCGHAFAEGDIYCGKCSQKRHLHMSLGGLVHEFVHTTLHLDGKFFKMLYCLFLPGRLTNDFLAGKQKRYPHPVRFFVVVSAAFLLFAFKVIVPDLTKGFEDGLNDNLSAKTIETVYMPVMGPTLSYASRTELFWADSTKMPMALPDSVKSNMLKTVFGLERDSGLLKMLRYDSASANLGSLNFSSSVPLKDLFVTHPDTILVRYDMDRRTGWKLFVGRQAVKLSQEPGAFLKSYLGKFTATFIFMILFQALIMKLLYWRQKRHYAEHVLFLMNLGTAMLLSLMVVVPFIEWLNLGWILSPLWLFGLLVYHLFSLKAVYKQSWPKTIFKFVLYTLSYLFIGLCIMVLAAFATVLIFD